MNWSPACKVTEVDNCRETVESSLLDEPNLRAYLALVQEAWPTIDSPVLNCLSPTRYTSPYSNSTFLSLNEIVCEAVVCKCSLVAVTVTGPSSSGVITIVLPLISVVTFSLGLTDQETFSSSTASGETVAINVAVSSKYAEIGPLILI